ncbi:MAG: hypothetical protein H6727_17655 [Myxococcales bacterium]|nr:hypothetical protein [Myxococcales bacterium]
MDKQKKRLEPISDKDLDRWMEALRSEPTPLSQDPGVEARFWQRFALELGSEEQKRQAKSTSPKTEGWALFRKMSVAFALAMGFYGFLWIQVSPVSFQTGQAPLAKQSKKPHIPTHKMRYALHHKSQRARGRAPSKPSMYQDLGMLREMEMMEDLDTIEWLDKKG